MITQLSQIVSGTIFKTRSGAHLTAVSTSADTNGVVRVILAPVRQLGSSPSTVVAVVDTRSPYSTDQSAVRFGDLFIFSAYGAADKVVAAFEASEVNLEAIPYSIQEGVYELPGGGRLLCQIDAIRFGKAGVVHTLTMTPRGIEFENGELLSAEGAKPVECSYRPGNASNIEVGGVFVTNHEGSFRVILRKSHGVQALDGLGHLPLSEISGLSWLLTTQETQARFGDGERVCIGAPSARIPMFGVVLDSPTPNTVRIHTTTGEIRTAEYKAVPGLPATSEFASRELLHGSAKVTRSVVDFVVPDPAPALPQVGDVIRYGGITDVVTNVSTNRDYYDLRSRRLDIQVSAVFGEYLHYHGNERRQTVIAKNGKYYGMPPFENLGKYRIQEAPIVGALYLRGDGDVVQAIPAIGQETTPQLATVFGSFECPSTYNWDDFGIYERLTVIKKVADPGCWHVRANSEGDPLEVHLTPPEIVLSIAGVQVPTTNDRVQNILARAPNRCPGCDTHLAVHYAVRVIDEHSDGTVTDEYVCSRCVGDVDECGHCGVRMCNAPTNSFGACNACYRSASFDVISDYGYKPKPRWHGVGPLFYGTEVELVFTDGARTRKATARDAIELSGGLLYAKRDGSIGDGVEYVTHPFSLDWLNEHEDQTMKRVFDRLRINMTDDECCGIHIHASKQGFEATPSSLPNGEKLTKERRIGRGLMRVQRFVYGNPELVVHFAGRRSTYASLDVDGKVTATPGRGHRGDGTPVREMKRLAENLTARKSGRYAAVNMTPHTVEFRIFKSTVVYEEYKRNILFIDSVIQYCRTHALPKNGEVGVRAYKKFLESNPTYEPVLMHLEAFMMAPRASQAAH